jgi:hypothetical protein
MWIIGQKIFSDKNILPIKTANIFGKQYFTNKHVLAGLLQTENLHLYILFPISELLLHLKHLIFYAESLPRHLISLALQAVLFLESFGNASVDCR